MADVEIHDEEELPDDLDNPDEEEDEEEDGEQPPATDFYPIPYDISGKEFYFCEICRKKFINYGSYRRHLRMHFCNKKYSCTICGRQFFRRYLWLKHQEKFHGDTLSSYECPHCSMTLKSFEILKEHLKTKHRRIHSLQELFSVPPSLGEKPHPPDDGGEGSEAKQKLYTCDVCNRKFQRRFQWLKHREQHVNTLPELGGSMRSDASSPEPMTCEDCGLECDTPGDLETHRKEEHRSDTGPGTSRYGRRIKQRVLYNSDAFLQGPKRARRSPKMASPPPVVASPPPVSHPQPPPAPPALSQETLRALVSAPSLISNPAITITPVPATGTPVQAPPSNVPIVSKVLLQKNQRGNFFCDKCHRVFINKSSYLRHKKMHTGVKPFTCEFCCMSFFRSESLNTHKKKHSDDPSDFRCYACGYKAANSASLRNHYYTICSKEQPPPPEPTPPQQIVLQKGVAERGIAGFCAICNRAFFNISNYQKHLQQHTDKTRQQQQSATSEASGNYLCVVCNRWFTDYHEYDEHTRTAHANNKGWDDYAACNDVFTVPFDSRQEVRAENGMNGTIIMCKLCPMAFTTRSSYDAHVTTHAPSWLEFCGYCGNPFKTKNELNVHEKTCFMVCTSEDRMYSCYQCGAYCESSSTLRDHVLDTHVPSSKPTTKPSLPAPSTSIVKKELVEEKVSDEVNSTTIPPETPEITIVKPEPTQVVVPIVDKVEIVPLGIDASPKIKEEPVAKSSSSRLFKCGQCDETFADMPTVFEHCKTVHSSSKQQQVPKSPQLKDIPDPPKSGIVILQNGPSTRSSSSNSIMKQLLSSPPAFQMSNSSILPPQPPPPQLHKCSLCLKSFTDKVAMERHEQLDHVMIDWYKCTICEKSGSQEVIERHMLTHMLKIGSMVTTSERADLEILEDTNHVPEPPQFISVLCQICKKIFSSFLTLGRHRHSESTAASPAISHPFICCMPNCAESFVLGEDVVKHLQTDHSSSQWNIEKLGKEPVVAPWKPENLPWKTYSEATSYRRIRDDDSFPDIYQMSDGEENSGGTKDDDDYDEDDDDDDDLDEITIEPLMDSAGDSKLGEENEQANADESASGEDQKSRPKFKCHDCDSVFTNPCSWKRHCKLHLGIMKHKCPHCFRMFYRKDHCDKHIKTHTHKRRKFRRELIFE